jgi:hypothetical protein
MVLGVLGPTLASCSGDSHPPDDPGPGTGDGLCTALPPVPQRLWRLSAQQYSNAVRDLLGLAVGPVVGSTGGTSEYAFFSDDAAGVDAQLLFQVSTATQTVLAEVAPRLPEMVGCQTGEDELACAQRFARSFGTRAFRRPLEDTELTALMATYTEGRKQDFATGIRLVMQALLQSPSFLFRSELGAPAASGTTLLTPYEVASQLSFTFLDSIPDQALLDAAANGSLSTEQGIAREIDRLLQMDTVKQNISRVVLDWFNVRQLHAKTKATTFFADLPAADQNQAVLQRDLVISTRRFIDGILWFGSGKVADLLTSPFVVVNQRLARLYGLPFPGSNPEEFVGVEAPPGQRSGMLTQPGVIWATSDPAVTSIVHRGIFIHNDVICADPVPAPGAILDDPEIQAKLAMLPTELDKSNYRLMTGQCAGCHRQIDPYGLVLEGFDPVGRHRTTADGLPVNPTGDFTASPPLTGQITGPTAFAQAVIATKQLSSCAVQKMTSYVVGRMIRESSTCPVKEAHSRFEKTDGTMASLFREVATAAFMRTRAVGAR